MYRRDSSRPDEIRAVLRARFRDRRSVYLGLANASVRRDIIAARSGGEYRPMLSRRDRSLYTTTLLARGSRSYGNSGDDSSTRSTTMILTTREKCNTCLSLRRGEFPSFAKYSNGISVARASRTHRGHVVTGQAPRAPLSPSLITRRDDTGSTSPRITACNFIHGFRWSPISFVVREAIYGPRYQAARFRMLSITTRGQVESTGHNTSISLLQCPSVPFRRNVSSIVTFQPPDRNTNTVDMAEEI